MTNNATESKKFSVVILAAGLSTRMGRPKLLLPFNDERTFIEQIVNTYSDFGCEDICVVVNEESARLLKKQQLKLKSTRLVINPNPEWQKFYSLQLAVKSTNKLLNTFIQNIDNPFINREILSKLVANRNEADYIIPTYQEKGGHPFLASSLIIQKVVEAKYTQTHFKKFMQQFSSIRIPVNDERVLVNINCMEDYESWFSKKLS